MPASSLNDHARFATTNWNLVGELRGPNSATALAALCERYWFPLYAFVRRKAGSDHEARDSTQAFFAWMLEKDLFRRAAADRGRLRSFLLTALQNFLRNEYQAGRRQMRGGQAVHLSLDFDEGSLQFASLPADRMSADRLYERTWALSLLNRTLLRLQNEMDEKGHRQRFEVLKPALSAEQAEGYDALAAQLGIREATARQAVARLRQRFRQLLLDEVQSTLADPEDVDDEIRWLFAAVRPASA